jgi:hypothetical protein
MSSTPHPVLASLHYATQPSPKLLQGLPLPKEAVSKEQSSKHLVSSTVLAFRKSSFEKFLQERDIV